MIFSYIIPLNDHQSNHLTTENGYFIENRLGNNLEQDKVLIYQESWVLKFECLQCYERWNKNFLVKNQSVNVTIKKKEEEEREGIEEEKENGKEDLKRLNLIVVKVKEAEDKNSEKEKIKEWMRKRMVDKEWLREWMDGMAG